MGKTQSNRASEIEKLRTSKPIPGSSGGQGGDGSDKPISNKLYTFFSHKGTRWGFSALSIGYLVFLIWISWLTFAYSFAYDNAVALFLVFAFVNVMFATSMIYTRKNIVTKIAVLLMHPILIFMLIYGFGNWYLLVPPFIAATVVFFAAATNESLKVILGTTYMILTVLAILVYVVLGWLGMIGDVFGKMNLEIREIPDIHVAHNQGTEESPFRLVAYVDTERQNATATFFIERTDLDRQLWNLSAQRVRGSVSVGTTSYMRDRGGTPTIIWETARPRLIEWREPNALWFDGRLVEINAEGEITAGDVADEPEPSVTTNDVTVWTPPQFTPGAPEDDNDPE
jgi:hypothetical protein